jgi:TRAP transporter TAXI family solute receptor
VVESAAQDQAPAQSLRRKALAPRRPPPPPPAPAPAQAPAPAPAPAPAAPVETPAEPDALDCEADVTSLEIVTAPTGSIFFPLGTAIAKQLERELGIPVTASPSAGSGENVILMDSGDAELSITASNALVPAYRGETPYDREYPTLRPIGRLFPNALIVYALKSSGFTKVSDLEGQRVGVGANSLTWDHFIAPFLASQGLTYGVNMTPVYAGFDDMANQVRDGQLAAAISTGGASAPAPAFIGLASELEVVVLEWDQEPVRATARELGFASWFEEYPGSVLPGYEGATYFTPDIGGPYLSTSSDLSPGTICAVTRIFYENLAEIASEVAVMNWALNGGVEAIVAPLGEMPFHDGAAAYWRSIGALD